MAKFSEALDRAVEDIKRPPPLPLGNYIFRVTKMPDPPREVQGQEAEILTISVAVVQPMEDVDPDALEEFGNVVGSPARVEFYFNTAPDEQTRFEQTLNRLKIFLESCGVDTSGSLKEALSQIANAQFVGEIGHRSDKNDHEIQYAEIRKTAPV